MLKLPVPKVNYHNIKTQPSKFQEDILKSLAERAERIRKGNVDPSADNMLKVTNDGRKLALDQRLINPMLPDDAGGKVNSCVDNVFQIWEENADTKAAQLIFCDLSTPKNDGSFNVYDDIRAKLEMKGVPKGQIRFIHEAASDAQKKELFGKVRSGEVRILIGSTQKMGAGTNVQDRLKAIHNLDCPWRPSDLEQRQGRIERQGNMFDEVDVYRYVTERTFDAYLYQIVENKQKFISQIMTSKSPARSAEDIDDMALSFAEVKMLVTGDPRFKEMMELDLNISKLKVLKQNHQNQQYDLEDSVKKWIPKKMSELQSHITNCTEDAEMYLKNAGSGESRFVGMTLAGNTYMEKEDAGKILLTVCKQNMDIFGVKIGSYKGFEIMCKYSSFTNSFRLTLKGKGEYMVELGDDIYGNITRTENRLAKIPEELETAKTKLSELGQQLESAKEQLGIPFEREVELTEMEKRMRELTAELDIDDSNMLIDTAPEEEIETEKASPDRER